MKIISYCLYGDSPRYHFGMEKNAKIAERLLPDWMCYVYYNDTLPDTIITRLSKYKNIHLIKINMIDHGMFWRFLPFYESENNICISRDADSRITEREVDCLKKWQESDKKFHIIRDHAQHYNMPIMGGMWGMKGCLNSDKLYEMQNFINASGWYYGKDQEWLSKLWGTSKDNCLIHGIRETYWFKETRDSMENPFNFIGNGWTEEEKSIYHHDDHGMVIN